MVNTEKINTLVTALTNKFEEKINRITSWTNASDANYPSAKLVKDSLDTLNSAKQDVSGKITEFTEVNATDSNYPSAALVKSQLSLKENTGNKVTQIRDNPDDSHYPSELLFQTQLNKKLEAKDLPTKTSDLVNDGTKNGNGTPFLTEHQSLASTVVTLEQQATADSGFASTYVLKQGGSALSPKINIPKDQLLQSASLETVGSTPSAIETAHELSAGDLYIKMIVNTEDSETGATTLIIPVNELVNVYTADNTTLVLSGSTFSIQNGGVGTTQLADSSVTTAKINAGAVTSGKIGDAAITTAKIDNGAVTEAKIDSELVASWLTTSDVDGEIDEYLEALTTALTPTQVPASGD